MFHHLTIALALVACSLSLAEDWREIKPPPTRQDVSDTYERMATLDLLDDVTKWRGADHGQSAQASVSTGEGRTPGTKGLRVIYTFTGRPGLEYVDVAGNVPIPDETTAVGLWMKAGDPTAQPALPPPGAPLPPGYTMRGHGLPARLRVLDANGECFQYNLRDLKPGEWVLGVASLDNPGVHWGGDNNGKLDRPCRVASFVFDKIVNSPTAQGELTIAEFGSYRIIPERLQPHGIKLFVPPTQSLLVYDLNQPITLAAAPDPADKAMAALPVRLSATLVDPFGKTLKTEAVTLAGTTPTPLELAPQEQGAYDLRLRVAGKEDDPDAPWADFRFAVLPAPPTQDEKSPWGVSTHFGQHWPLAVMTMIARAGIKFYRDEISWGNVEREPGKLVVPDRFREYIAEGRRLGLEPLIILDYANKLYDEGNFPVTPETRAAFARYATTLATELPAIRFFEVWNECPRTSGMGGRRGTAADYAPLYLEAAKAVRAANPQATVIGIGGEWDGKAFGDMMGQGAGAAMDGFSIHPYMYPGLPGEGFAKHLTTDAERAEAAAGKPLPLWITEIGWPTELDGRGSDWLHQARCLVRTMLIARANGTQKICWYDFKDDGLKLTYNENNFGLVHHEQFGLAPKPAYVAYAHLINILHGRKLVRHDLSPNGHWVMRLEGPNDVVDIFWTEQATDRRAVGAEALRVENMFGQPIHTGAVPISPDPVFVFSRRR